MIETDVPLFVFFDDLGQATPAVQGAVMQLLLARKINGKKISPLVTFGAATNRRQDKAGVTGLITPLVDRFTTILQMDFDMDDWVKWGIDHDMPSVLLAFNRFKPDLLGKFDASRDIKKSPTPRSVAGLGRHVNRGILDLEVLQGTAGEAYATEFVGFHRIWEGLPDRDAIYRAPDTAPVPTRPDVLYACMGMLAHGIDPTLVEPTVRYISRVPQEMQVLCMKDGMLRDPKIKDTPAFNQWFLNNRTVFF
jgi:hypothetical protein